jgi:hypothetical protein
MGGKAVSKISRENSEISLKIESFAEAPYFLKNLKNCSINNSPS